MGPIALAAVLFGAGFALRLAVGPGHEELVLLYAIPVAILGVALGPLAGVAGAAVAIALLVARVAIQDLDLAPADYLIRAGGLLALGIGLGVLSEHRRRAAEMLRAVVESATDAVYLKDTDGRYRIINTAGAAMMGRTPEEMLGRTDVEIFGEVGRSAAAADRRVLSTGRPDRVEGEVTVRGDSRVLSTSQSPLRDNLGRLRGVVGVSRDVTEHRRTLAALAASEERFRLLVDGVEDYAICMLDPQGRVVSWNRGAERIEGHRAEDIVGTSFAVGYPPEAREAGEPERDLAEAARTGRAAVEAMRVRADGSRYWASVVITALRGEGGELRGFAKVTHDISAIRRREQELSAAELRFRMAFEEAPTGIALADLQGAVFQANAALAEMVGTEVRALFGSTLTGLVHDDHAPVVARAVAELLAGERASTQGELRLRPADGRLLWALVSLTLVRDVADAPAYFIVQAQDVTERRRAEAALAHQALHDPLTGLPNRTLLLDRLGHALDRARREPALAALLFVDLDRFKPVNDSLGHAAGDVVLVEVARRLADVVRGGDTVARLGGDEFVVFAERLDSPQDALQVAQRAAAAIREPIEVEGHALHLDASIGIAFADNEAPDELLANADAAMYEAKQRRAEHALYHEQMRSRASRRLELETGLRRALDAGEIAVRYQPQVDLATGEPVGVEALARWQDPRRGLVLPGEFVPLAEETGLIGPLGDRVLALACHDAAGWAAAGTPVTVAVNLSPRQFAAPGLVARVSEALADSGLDPERLCLEITETAVMNDVEAARSMLAALKALGVGIAIDDFGTGYSSLSYLTRFPVDVLKIDRSFVHGLERSDEAALVGAIIAMGHALGVRIVAEGIESESQVEELSWLTCDIGQGFLFGAAQDEGAIRALLDSRRRFGPAGRLRRPPAVRTAGA